MNCKKCSKYFFSPKLTVLAVLILCGIDVLSQTTISFISELIATLGKSNIDAKMVPGTYQITTADFGSDKTYSSNTLFSFTGSNSTYDFTGVTFEFATDLFQAFGNIEVNEVAIWGSNIILKNLTMVDIGDTRPSKTALGILLDGTGNTVQGFHMSVRGSYPYGYGDIFGKGSGYVIKHYKHSAILVRGDGNHLKNCTIIHRAYGHGIFCQGSVDATIEGCYVEGEMRTTDEVLAEAGTGSPADEKDFMSVWGYKVPSGFMFSLQEDGIRAYNTGSYNGGERNTSNMIVRNCTVKNMRSGVTIGFCDNTKYVENCTSLGCENGYWVGGSGQIVNSCGDAKYGFLLTHSYQNDKNNVIDLKVLDNTGAYGNEMSAYIGGSGHNITLRNSELNPNQNMRVMISGIKVGLRFQVVDPTYNDFTSSSVQIYNRTNYPMVLASKSSNCSGVSGGLISDSGTNNSISNIEVDQTLLGKQNQSIYFPEIPEKTLNDVDFWPGATSFSGLTISYTSSNPAVATIANGKIHIVGVGTTTISASQGGDVVFNPASNVSKILTVEEGSVPTRSNHDQLNLEDDFLVYPNPVFDVLVVEKTGSKTIKVDIFDDMGAHIISTKIEAGKGLIDISRLNTGLYLVKIEDGKNLATKKILKN